jgi:hypothetical protein
VVNDFLERAVSGPSALVIDGEPGIGKTTLWRWGLENAERLGLRVLSCRAAEAEAKLSFFATSHRSLWDGRPATNVGTRRGGKQHGNTAVTGPEIFQSVPHFSWLRDNPEHLKTCLRSVHRTHSRSVSTEGQPS